MLDEWIAKNPKSTAYMLYLSAVIIIVLLIAIKYYIDSQEYMSIVDRKLIAERTKRERADAKRKEANKPLGENEDPHFIEEEEGFKILVDPDD